MSDDQNDDSAEYGNKHRAFLQALSSRQTITFDEARPLIAAIESAQTPDRPTTANDVTPEDFRDYIHTVNNAISPFDFEIRTLQHQTTKERVYAFINTTSDAITQMSTMHSADEIAFVKRVLDAMFETYNTEQAEVMAITSLQALKLAKANDTQRRETQMQTQTQSAQGLTMTQAERVLGSMVEEGWFELSQKGYFSLTPRALMELRGWLMDMYNDQDEVDEDDEDEDGTHEKIKSCAACRDIVTVGQRCPNLQCNVRVHNHCVRNMFRAQRENEKCPTCQTEWKDPPPVGEKAAATGGRRSTNGIAGRRSSGMHREDDSDAEGGAV
jgi:hypothetical protein